MIQGTVAASASRQRVDSISNNVNQMAGEVNTDCMETITSAFPVVNSGISPSRTDSGKQVNNSFFLETFKFD